MGAPAARPTADAVPDAAEFRGTLGGGRHPGEAAETVRERSAGPRESGARRLGFARPLMLSQDETSAS